MAAKRKGGCIAHGVMAPNNARELLKEGRADNAPHSYRILHAEHAPKGKRFPGARKISGNRYALVEYRSNRPVCVLSAGNNADILRDNANGISRQFGAVVYGIESCKRLAKRAPKPDFQRMHGADIDKIGTCKRCGKGKLGRMDVCQPRKASPQDVKNAEASRSKLVKALHDERASR